MKYIFELASKTDLYSYEAKHEKVINGLKSIAKPWGIEEGVYPAPTFGSNIVAFFKLNKLLGSGIKGHVMYFFRRVSGNAENDTDRINIEFNPQKIDYIEFIKKTLKEYISFFEPSYLNVFDENIIFYDYERFQHNKSKSNSFRFNAVVFWSEEFCREKLNLSLTDLKNRIAGYVEKIEFFNNGIIIVASSRFLSLEEANLIDKKLKEVSGINE